MANNGYVQFDPAVIEQARQIDLLSYLQRYEPSNLKRVAGNVYCTREHDSLKISNGKWYWWSRGIGGYSALDYLMKVRELGFVEAVQTLTGDMGDWKPPPPAVKKDEPKVLLLPEKNPNCDKVTEYLFGRGIDYQLIQDCIAEGIIFESRPYHNAVFVGKDESGKPKYAALRSTLGSSFRQDASGSDKRYSFRLLAREPTDKVHLFEAAIDLLSYATYLKCEGKDYRAANLLSLSGVYQPKKEAFLREMVRGYQLCEKPDPEFYKMMRELSAIGNRINQLAVKANALGFVDTPMLREEARKWHEFQIEIRKRYLLPRRSS